MVIGDGDRMIVVRIRTLRIMTNQEDQVAKLMFEGWAWKGRRVSLGWPECNDLRITGGRQGLSR